MTEETSLPLARMATISKPSFWIFIGSCIFLYIYNKTAMPDTNAVVGYQLNETLIIASAFAGLFLNLIAGAIKDQRKKRAGNILCYTVEAASVILITIKVIIIK